MATPKLALKKGDKVLCIDDSSWPLEKGVTYTVKRVGGGSLIWLKGLDIGYSRFRFRKVTEIAPAGQAKGKSHKSKAEQLETKLNKINKVFEMPREKAIQMVLGMIRQEIKEMKS